MTRPPTRRPRTPAAPTAVARPQTATGAPSSPPPIHWVEHCLLIAGTALVGAGFLMISGRSALLLATTTAAAAALVGGVGLHGWRRNQRRHILAGITDLLTQLTKTAVIIERARWTGRLVGQIAELRLRYSDLAAATYGSQIALVLSQAVEQAFARPFRTTNHQPEKRRITFTAKPATPTKDLTELERQQQRVRDVVNETFGADATSRQRRHPRRHGRRLHRPLPISSTQTHHPRCQAPSRERRRGAPRRCLESQLRSRGRRRHFQSATSPANLRKSPCRSSAQTLRPRIQPHPTSH